MFYVLSEMCNTVCSECPHCITDITFNNQHYQLITQQCINYWYVLYHTDDLYDIFWFLFCRTTPDQF